MIVLLEVARDHSVEAGRSGSPESRVWSLVQKHSGEAPGSSVALPEMSGKVAGGFGSVSNRIRKDFVMIL